MYKAIIFDIGDTLLERYPNQAQIYLDRLKVLDLDTNDITVEIISKALEKAANGQIAKEQNGAPRMSDEDFSIMLDMAAINCVVSISDVSSYLQKLKAIPFPEQVLRVIPGAVETLDALKKRRFRLAVVSNYDAGLPRFLEQIGLADFFETIVVSGVVGVEKPDIRIMQIALDRLSLRASECLYVGDHPFDVLCAKKAGMDCAWLTAPDDVLPDSVPYKEDYRIGKLEELLFIRGIC